MPAFRWLRPRAHGALLPIVSVTHDQSYILCGPPSSYAVVALHFLGSGSVPCLDDGCRHCESMGAEIHAYAPALQMNRTNGEYTRCVLDMGDPLSAVASMDLRGFRVRLQRKKKHDDTYTGIRIGEQTAIDPVLLQRFGAVWFDVRPRLEQRWGMAAVAHQANEEPSAAPPTPAPAPAADEDRHILPFGAPPAA